MQAAERRLVAAGLLVFTDSASAVMTVAKAMIGIGLGVVALMCLLATWWPGLIQTREPRRPAMSAAAARRAVVLLIAFAVALGVSAGFLTWYVLADR